MRDYGIVTPGFWTGETGKKLRGDVNAQLLALYLMTSPHSTMTGVFHCPILYMAHETGIPIEGAQKALARLIEGGFCEYDEASETVFVVQMARFQIGAQLKPNDKRVFGLRKSVDQLPKTHLKQRFLEVYAEAFCIADMLENEAPSKPLRSQDQEQDQEQDQDQEHAAEASPSGRVKKSPVEIKTYLASCKAEGRKPIPEDDTIFQYAEEINLPHDFLRLCWREFVERNTDSKKRYADWRAHFRKCVRSNWYKLWWVTGDNQYELTTTGKQAQLKHGRAVA